MKPRQYKKLCNKVRELAGKDVLGSKPWLDSKEPFADAYLNMRHRYKCTMTHLWVIGGGPDYWGEAMDPRPLYDVAWEWAMWTFGTQKEEPVYDPDGHVIAHSPGYPTYPKRMTGKEVISLLRQHCSQS